MPPMCEDTHTRANAEQVRLLREALGASRDTPRRAVPDPPEEALEAEAAPGAPCPAPAS